MMLKRGIYYNFITLNQTSEGAGGDRDATICVHFEQCIARSYIVVGVMLSKVTFCSLGELYLIKREILDKQNKVPVNLS